MRVIKITDRKPYFTEDGEWVLFCKVRIGKSYQYGKVVCKSEEEAYSIKEGQLLDIEKTPFVRNTNNIQAK